MSGSASTAIFVGLNLASVAVTLPSSFQIDQSNLGNICSETQLAANDCAGRQRVGTAAATAAEPTPVIIVQPNTDPQPELDIAANHRRIVEQTRRAIDLGIEADAAGLLQPADLPVFGTVAYAAVRLLVQ